LNYNFYITLKEIKFFFNHPRPLLKKEGRISNSTNLILKLKHMPPPLQNKKLKKEGRLY